MKIRFFLITFFVFLGLSVQAANSNAKSDLDRDLKSLQLNRYERAGASVSKFLRLQFVDLIDQSNETNFSERFNQAYSEQLRPGALENLSTQFVGRPADEFLADIQKALELRRRHVVEFRTKPLVRKKIQNVFVGLLHVLEIRIHNELGSSLEELVRLRRYLLNQATFVAKGSGNRLMIDDLWWDWMWLRGHEEPSDLVELHLQKVQGISLKANAQWKERLRKYSLSVSLQALRREAEPLLQKEKPAVVSLRLVNDASSFTGENSSADVLKELKLYQYKYLQATGKTDEAREIKKDIAKDLFIAKGKQLFWAPTEPWARKDIGFFSKITSSVSELIHSFLTFLTYGAGFLFVATPIELLLVVFAGIILSRQARAYFNVESRTLHTRWKDHRLFEQQGWKRVPSFTKDGLFYVKEETALAWRMFVASYTMVGVPFYSKIAASLLLFGIGLYFNSARTLVEAVVTQMTM